MANTETMHMFIPQNRLIYNFNIYQVGYEKCDAKHSFGPAIRDFYVMHFLISGKGKYTIRGKEYKLEKGDCFLVVPNEKIYYQADPDEPYEYYWVAFHGQCAKDVMERAGFYVNDNFVYSRHEEYDELFNLFKSMNDVAEKPSHNDMTLLGYLYLLLGFMAKENNLPKDKATAVTVLELINQYIVTNYHQEITIDNLAKFASMHRSNLYRLFKKNYGMSPMQYITEYRLNKALFMIKNSDLNTNQIAYACGFNDASYFCRVFKKKFKKSPNEVKRLV